MECGQAKKRPSKRKIKIGKRRKSRIRIKSKIVFVVNAFEQARRIGS
jgi:hypothetical protein